MVTAFPCKSRFWKWWVNHRYTPRTRTGLLVVEFLTHMSKGDEPEFPRSWTRRGSKDPATAVFVPLQKGRQKAWAEYDARTHAELRNAAGISRETLAHVRPWLVGLINLPFGPNISRQLSPVLFSGDFPRNGPPMYQIIRPPFEQPACLAVALARPLGAVPVGHVGHVGAVPMGYVGRGPRGARVVVAVVAVVVVVVVVAAAAAAVVGKQKRQLVSNK